MPRKENNKEVKKKYPSANFYVKCPSCSEILSFQGVDIQYYKPIGAELKVKDYTNAHEAIDTGKAIACSKCNTVSLAKDCEFFNGLH